MQHDEDPLLNGHGAMCSLKNTHACMHARTLHACKQNSSRIRSGRVLGVGTGTRSSDDLRKRPTLLKVLWQRLNSTLSWIAITQGPLGF